MDSTRRDWLRSLGALGISVGVAGCSSGSQESPDGNQETDTESTTTQTQTQSGDDASEETTTESADFGESNDSESTQTKGENPAETESLGSVATDKQTDGLTLTDHYHYSMNGVQGVAGTVKNESDTEFETVTVHATVNAGDAGPYSRALKTSLPAGESQRFQFKFGDDAPDTVESYTIWATGDR